MKGFKILSSIISLLATIISIFFSFISRIEYQQFQLWQSVDIIIFEWFITISFFFIIHIIIGAAIFGFSFFQCIEIVKINNQAHEAKNQPKELLDYGYYAKVRHPMTIRFFLIAFSFLFMLSYLIVIPLIFLFALIFTLISLYEEKKILLPIFSEKYKEYMKRVRNRFFTGKLKMLIIFLFCFIIFRAIFIL